MTTVWEFAEASAGLVFVLLAVKGSAVIALGLVISARDTSASAAHRSACWTAIALGLLCLPALTAALPRVSVPIERLDLQRAVRGADHLTTTRTFVPGGERTAGEFARREARDVSPLGAQARAVIIMGIVSAAFVVLWAAGAALSLGRLFRAVRRARQLGDRAARVPRDHRAAAEMARALADVGVTRLVRLYVSDEVQVPVMLGVRRPSVILPLESLEWTNDRLRTVLLHEVAHVARGDYAARTCWEVVRAVYWMNPLVWWAATRARTEVERAADDRVLTAGTNPIAYAEQLVRLARRAQTTTGTFAIGMAFPSSSPFKERLRAILATSLNREPVTRRRAAGWASAIVAATALVAASGMPASADALDTDAAPRAMAVTGVSPPTAVSATSLSPGDSARWVLTPASSTRDTAAFQLLFAPARAERLAAARVARTFGSAAIVHDIVTVFADTLTTCSAMRWRAARGLRELRDARAVPHLVDRLIADPDSNVRAMAANAIAAAGSDDGARLLRTALVGARPAVFGRVGRALETLGDTRAHRTLLRALREAREASRPASGRRRTSRAHDGRASHVR